MTARTWNRRGKEASRAPVVGFLTPFEDIFKEDLLDLNTPAFRGVAQSLRDKLAVGVFYRLLLRATSRATSVRKNLWPVSRLQTHACRPPRWACLVFVWREMRKRGETKVWSRRFAWIHCTRRCLYPALPLVVAKMNLTTPIDSSAIGAHSNHALNHMLQFFAEPFQSNLQLQKGTFTMMAERRWIRFSPTLTPRQNRVAQQLHFRRPQCNREFHTLYSRRNGRRTQARRIP